MSRLDELLGDLGARFGVLAEGSTSRLAVIARDADVALGDLFILPCRRGPDRLYLFRVTEYANVLGRTYDQADVARNKLTMPDSYYAEDLAEDHLVELDGALLGYAELDPDRGEWEFRRPRRLPQHLTDVFRVDATDAASGTVVAEVLRTQLGDDGIEIGHLLAGERALPAVPVRLPVSALAHHVGVFGRTGSGKSNLIMVILAGVLAHNRRAAGTTTRRASVFAIDPHDEFRSWHAPSGGPDGLRGIVARYDEAEYADLVAPFYYLTTRDAGLHRGDARVRLSRGDIVPDDLASIIDFSEQQAAFARQLWTARGEHWIGSLFAGEASAAIGGERASAEYLPGTIAAVERRLGFLGTDSTRLVTRFDPEMGLGYESTLPDLLAAIERGRVLVVDTTLMGELEQFLLNTVVARTLFALRRAVRLADTPRRLLAEVRAILGSDPESGRVGQASLAEAIEARILNGDLPYLDGGRVRAVDELPVVHVLVEEAPSVLNPARMRFGSVFRDISRQGRKFGIGLGVVSQQVSEIDKGILSQVNTHLVMALGNADERREAVRASSVDMGAYASELQALGRGQLLLATTFRDVALPVEVARYAGASPHLPASRGGE